MERYVLEGEQRGLISLTTGDSWKGCLDSSFVFSVCMYVCVFGGDEVVC